MLAGELPQGFGAPHIHPLELIAAAVQLRQGGVVADIQTFQLVAGAVESLQGGEELKALEVPDPFAAAVHGFGVFQFAGAELLITVAVEGLQDILTEALVGELLFVDGHRICYPGRDTGGQDQPRAVSVIGTGPNPIAWSLNLLAVGVHPRQGGAVLQVKEQQVLAVASQEIQLGVVCDVQPQETISCREFLQVRILAEVQRKDIGIQDLQLLQQRELCDVQLLQAVGAADEIGQRRVFGDVQLCQTVSGTSQVIQNRGLAEIQGR